MTPNPCFRPVGHMYATVTIECGGENSHHILRYLIDIVIYISYFGTKFLLLTAKFRSAPTGLVHALNHGRHTWLRQKKQQQNFVPK